MFVTIFSTVYSIYNKMYFYFNPKPKQLFSYDHMKKQIYVSGYCGYTDIRIPLNYFSIKGNYIIELNGSRIVSFIDNVLENTEEGFVYYLGNNYVQAQSKILIKITDGLTESFGQKLINVGETINYEELIAELLPDEI